MRRLLWMAAFAALMFGIGWLAVRLLARRQAADYRRDAAKLERISALSLEEAASRAASLLSDGRLFRVVEAPPDDDAALQSLAPELRNIFRRYESIELVQVPWAHVARASLGPSVHQPGFLRIGDVASGTDVEGEIAVRPGEEAIYEVHADEAPDPKLGTHRSIYHWLIATAQEAE